MNKSKLRIDLQNELNLPGVPHIAQLQQWVQATLQRDYADLEHTIRIVDEAESQALNQAYRGKDRPTNVLSFPAEASEFLDYDHLGDLVICAAIVEAEAQQQGKPVLSHWAHMVVHGMLHLQGFDHLNHTDAAQMEALEIEILAALGHTNPYLSKSEDING